MMNDEQLRLIHGKRGLYGETCACGAEKEPGKSFCGACYRSLCSATQTALYKRVGHGYESVHAQAIEELKVAGRVKEEI